ncbi:hypothetical protein [Bacillus sp. AFS055030]|uniref:hypothetical protein n=1 Tax=Bacillus sp. AFS055030 TaxID=2033507 RepID=UPI000BFB6698|nr:hypothetical protein [Bacillus sp. AFS055030]PGL72616.1 hypothetical protein CN925_04485 [Bacillus sp. AFS055030]
MTQIDRNKVFPNLPGWEISKQNIQIQTYGRRFYKDQTYYEYLIEFLLVFVSPKGRRESILTEEMKERAFTLSVPENAEIYYYPSPRVALKRYIFFNRSEQDKRFPIDKKAWESHRELLEDKIDVQHSYIKNKDFILDSLQDLLYGFNAVIGKRSWFAQSLLPIAPNLIFCESMGNKNKRLDLFEDIENPKCDSEFGFTQHMFMARGGELYFLHLAQALQEDEKLKSEIEQLLKELVCSVPQIESIAQFLQSSWEEESSYFSDEDNNQVNGLNHVALSVKWIPATFIERGKKSAIELKNLLQAEIEPVEKINLLSTMIVVQVLQLFCLQSQRFQNKETNLEWLVDLTGDSTSLVRKMAVQSYSKIEEEIFTAVHFADSESYEGKLKKDGDISKLLEDASDNSTLLIRKLGKDIGLIIPPTGSHMRLAFNEELIKTFVLSIVPAGERMLLSTFLEKLYGHFNIIVGPSEAKKHFESQVDIDYSSFDINQQIFQNSLKSCGFLRDLSDATSIVENPFKE